MPPVTSDNDLPKLLNTPTKQVKRIKKLVSEHLGSASKRVDRPPMQGMFSRTFFVTLVDGREVVIQFRTEQLDLDAFKVAKGALGPVVPEAIALQDEELEKEGVWAYSLERLPGKMWVHGVAGKGAEGRIAVNRSLGRVLSKGCLADTSGEAMSTKVRPHLEAILASPLDEVATYRPLLQEFIDKLDEISKLPLWVSHYDLNDVNVLIDESCEVTGLIDWELSTPKPFGVGLGRIHTLAGEYTGGEFWMPDEFEVAERAFWKELFAGMSQKTRGILEENIGLVQDAVILGTLLDTFFWEDGKVGCGGVSIKALPKFLTYRIPQVRGDEPPYKE
jgi:aminoglycoside phosphotransferase (APT) family kinase protein